MKPLLVEPIVPFPISERPFQIIVAGCGGNGSHVAMGLGRLCYHLRETNGPPVNVVLIDGDHFEPKNVGRQNCRPHDVGKNKAKALAARVNGEYNLRVEAIPEMLTYQLLESLLRGEEDPQWGAVHANVIIVGCVDNPDTRLTLHRELPADLAAAGWRRWLWLDVGNHEYTGQVILGSAREWGALRGAMALSGMCGALPSPGLLLPNLITSPAPKKPPKTQRGKKKAQEAADCATDAASNRQAFNINAVLGNIALEYLTQMIVNRRVTRFRTTVDLLAFTAQSDAITLSTLAKLSGRDANWLRGKQPTEERTSDRATKRSVRKRGNGSAGDTGAGILVGRPLTAPGD
jgi:PRTRC genetic system ThiF family protein